MNCLCFSFQQQTDNPNTVDKEKLDALLKDQEQLLKEKDDEIVEIKVITGSLVMCV